MVKLTGYSEHTLKLMMEYAKPEYKILDIGCGNAATTYAMEQKGYQYIHHIDIKDFRQFETKHFCEWDGTNIPFEDNFFDFVSMNFVLHHVPNEKKEDFISEAKRVSKKYIFILEDTPRNIIDRIMSNLHGAHYRRKIKSEAGYGFLSKQKWEELFNDLGLGIEISQREGRFTRKIGQPYARSFFLLTAKSESL